MGQKNDYLERAAEAERLAELISFEPDRERMLDAARSLRRLAEQVAAAAAALKAGKPA